MKTSILLLLTILLSFNAFSQSNKAYFELLDLNKQWKDYKNIINEDIEIKSEEQKIQFHLEKVISYLKEKTPNNLDENQKLNRATLLNELKTYASKKIFPTNLYHSVRTPYFVDDYGVHCAVGYMMKQSGNEQLVSKIQLEHNYDYIKDIKTDGINTWANTYGFTIDELKWIQPTYGVTTTHNTLLGGTNGLVNKMCYQSYPTKILSFSGEFDTIDNFPCKQIAYYNGESLNCYADGLTGKINDITTKDQDDLYVVGLLEHNGINYSIAEWNGTSWDFLNIPGIEGAEITSISSDYPILYGHFFSVINPNNSNKSEIWSYKDNYWTKYASINGRIYDIKNSNDSETYFAGHFDSVFISGFNDTLLANNVLIKDYSNNWSVTGNQVCDTVYSIEQIGNAMYFGGSCKHNEICLSSYLNDALQPLFINTSYDSSFYRIKDLEVKNNELLVAGKFSVNTMMTYGQNLASYDLVSHQLIPQGSLNKEINAIKYFDDEEIIGGSFNQNFFNDSKFLAKLYNPNDTTSIINLKNTISLSPNPFRNHLTLEGDFKNFEYTIINTNGKTIKTGFIEYNKIENLENINNGIYFLKVFNEKESYISKISKK